MAAKKTKVVKSVSSSTDTLRPEDVSLVLADLNDVAPDTLDEGAYSRWKLTKLERKGDEWVLHYTNSGYPKGSFVRFRYAGPCVIKNKTAKKWEDAAFNALAAENRDEDIDYDV